MGHMTLTADWSKSTFSAYNGSCLEARMADGMVQVRDSKDPDGAVLTFTRNEWAAFLAASRQGMN